MMGALTEDRLAGSFTSFAPMMPTEPLPRRGHEGRRPKGSELCQPCYGQGFAKLQKEVQSTQSKKKVFGNGIVAKPETAKRETVALISEGGAHCGTEPPWSALLRSPRSIANLRPPSLNAMVHEGPVKVARGCSQPKRGAVSRDKFDVGTCGRATCSSFKRR